MKLTDRLQNLWNDINLCNWEDREFSWDKAYVCSVFSKIAYLHIPAYELEDIDRVNIIPCEEYRNLIISNTNSSIEEALQGFDSGGFFVVERTYAVAIAIKVGDLVFVSIRGTKYLYDWLANLNAMKVKHGSSERGLKFHKGFYRAIVPCIDEVYANLEKRFGANIKIYVTGHSLGGALAAIFHSLSDRSFYYRYFYADDSTHQTHSCFTFGMPRYGNLQAISQLRTPYHIYNEHDVVPTLPPRLLGFEDVPIEFCLDDKATLKPVGLKGDGALNWIWSLATAKGIKHHDMEVYIDRIDKYRT